MNDNIDLQGENDGIIQNPRELHAGSAESTQATQAPSSKRFEMMLAGAASLTLVAFLLALWKIIA
ncbi:MAG: hypothetical protein H8E27_04685 [Verrucomicrobia subdivision 3 bacterium]|nr:hypothetical protein [Limisphaerales bacterium]